MVTIYHNPRCSKSRQALTLLQERAVVPVIIEYLKTPLTLEEVTALFAVLKIDNAHEMIRPKEAEYQEVALSKNNSNEEILKAIAAYPKLLERPIVVTDKGAAICRPPEKILNILQHIN